MSCKKVLTVLAIWALVGLTLNKIGQWDNRRTVEANREPTCVASHQVTIETNLGPIESTFCDTWR